MQFTSNWGHLFCSLLFSKHSFWRSSYQSKSLCCLSQGKWTIRVADYTDGANNIQAGRDRRDRQAGRQNTSSVSRAPRCINHYPKCKAERTSLVTDWSDRWATCIFSGQLSLGHNPIRPTLICHQLITLKDHLEQQCHCSLELINTPKLNELPPFPHPEVTCVFPLVLLISETDSLRQRILPADILG